MSSLIVGDAGAQAGRHAFGVVLAQDDAKPVAGLQSCLVERAADGRGLVAEHHDHRCPPGCPSTARTLQSIIRAAVTVAGEQLC